MSRAGWRRRKGLLRWCIGCQLVEAAPHSRYCEACRRHPCPECHHVAGQHNARCVYLRRTRRPRLTKILDRVELHELLAMLIRERPAAIRIARSICGGLLAEDCASEVALYLLEKRRYLRRVPTPAYFHRGVVYTALRVQRSAWHRHVVAMDPGDILIAEEVKEGQRRGHPVETAVRLPESVA